jgi:FMN phosphatase YigB (HAD superfamily)
MIRAIFFDFYGVWVPDRFAEYLRQAEQHGPVITNELQGVVGRYFQGKATPAEVAESFQLKLNRPDIDAEQFTLLEPDIAPEVGDFMRELHGHFVKLGVLANLGIQEYRLLNSFNQHSQLFEVITGPLPLGLNVPLLSKQVFAAALQAIGEPPQSCLVITDNESYATFAKSLGIGTMPFEGLPKLQQTLNEVLTKEAAG